MSKDFKIYNNNQDSAQGQQDGQKFQVTTIDELKSYQRGQLVVLPPFAEGQPFIARLRRPSLMVLIKSGKIPNQLIAMATKMFANGGGAIDSDDADSIIELLDVVDVLAEAAFVQPTYKQLQEAGIQLTDDQYMALFSYTQNGVEGLKSFRKQQ